MDKRSESQFERNDPIHNDSYNIGLTSILEGGPTVETLMMRNKMLGEERSISGSGLAQGVAAAKKHLAKGKK